MTGRRLCVLGATALLLGCALVYMYRRERRGEPVFVSLQEEMTRREALALEARIPELELGGSVQQNGAAAASGVAPAGGGGAVWGGRSGGLQR